MTETCCCGCCTLTTATTVAMAISILESIYGLFWNAQILSLFYGQNLCIFANYVDVAHFDDIDAVNGLVLASVGIHIFWMIFAIMALRANVHLHRGLMTPWILFTYLLTGFDTGSSIYFLVKFQSHFRASPVFYSDGPTAALSYLVMTILFSRGLIMWIVNVYLAYVVSKRGKEIDHNNSLLAFYIMSHLSHAPESQLETGPLLREPPPAYCHAGYFPKYVAAEPCSLDTSWSMNNGDNQGTAGATAFSNPMFPRFAQNSVTDLRQNVIRGRGIYGSPSIEQSMRTSEGVLP